MCEPLLPIDELKSLKFAINALVDGYPKGSYERENAMNAARGINSRLDWVIRQLSYAKEGRKNLGA